MKIGMMVDTYLPILGGAEVHVLELSRALSQRGYEIAICTAVGINRENGVLRVQSARNTPFQGGRVGMEETGDEFPVLRLPMLSGGGWRAALSVPLALPRLVAYIQGVDFVHCHYSFLMSTLGTLLGRLLGKPTAVTLHGLGTLDSSVSRSALWRVYRSVSLKLADTIIATSEEMKKVALRFAPTAKITVIPNGVNSRAFSPSPVPASKDGELVILTMRRLAPKNGVQYLVEAAPEVVAAIPGARFWVAGEGKLEGYIRKRVTDLGLDGYFRFLGIVPHARTPEFYRKADIAVFPSSAESTSLACLEAMCTEKAIVASGLTTYKELLGESGERGILVPLFDREESDYNAPLTLPRECIQSLAQAIIALAQDSGLRARLGQAARRFAAERYDWSTIAAQTARIYQGERS